MLERRTSEKGIAGGQPASRAGGQAGGQVGRHQLLPVLVPGRQIMPGHASAM
jgi:hypothetical protein